jgi:hypothetical protein
MDRLTNDQVIVLIKQATKAIEDAQPGRTDTHVTLNARHALSAVRELIKLREFFDDQDTFHT